MRRATTQMAVMLVTALALGCGGFENESLKVAHVVGKVRGAVKSQSLVMCREKPESRDEPAEHEDGAFEVEVPVGDSELFVVASNDRAARVPILHAKAGELRDIGEVEPVGAGRLKIQVRVSGGVHVEGITVTVEGTPYANMPVDANNAVTIAPMAEGAYTVSAHVPGFSDKSLDVTVSAGAETEAQLEFERDDSGNEATCFEHGCTNGLVCSGEGRCVAQGNANVCESCTEDSQCGSGQCRSASGGARVCYASCNANGGCPHGFTCNTADQTCEPDGAEIKGCGGYNQVGASCSDDALCQSLVGASGICSTSGESAGSCTLTCTATSDCPSGFACEPDGAGKACHPNP